MPLSPDLYALHRYFIWADRMRVHVDEVLRRQSQSGQPMALESPEFIDFFLYSSYWYGGLYTVIEGWQTLRLSDPTIDGLLQRADLVDLLRRYRNGSFHFQRDYFDDRFNAFIREQGSATWIRQLTQAFSDYFLR